MRALYFLLKFSLNLTKTALKKSINLKKKTVVNVYKAVTVPGTAECFPH